LTLDSREGTTACLDLPSERHVPGGEGGVPERAT
jgi:hypothetical protein